MVLGSVDPMKASLVGRLLLHLLGSAAERAGIQLYSGLHSHGIRLAS